MFLLGAYSHQNVVKFKLNVSDMLNKKINKMIALVKATQESKIKGELYINKLQESVDFINGAKLDEYEKEKKQKEKKNFS